MRIISGTHKGRKIVVPKGFNLRPTTDKAKEALFNILANKVDFKLTRALDLYSGLGGITLELASRGCLEIISVDINPHCTDFIKNTAAKFNMQNVKTITSSAYGFLHNNKKSWNIIFADPPYDIQGTEKIPDWIFKNNNLTPGGILIIEHPAELTFEFVDRLIERRVYGRVNFSFFM